RTVRPVTVAHGSQHGTADPDLRMTVHARLARRHAGEGRLLDGSVAVTAVDLQTADVMTMAERDGLLNGGVGTRVVGGTHRLGGDPAHGGEKENRPEDTD